MHNKEQSTVQSTEQSSVQSSVQPSGQSTVHSNDIYVYAVGMLPVLSICVCVFFAYNTFQSKKLLHNEKRSTIKTTPYAFKKYTINGYFWLEKKNWKFYHRQIDHNSHRDRNILHIKGGKRKTTKGVHECHGYCETCWWNSRWCPCQELCSLQKMDQGVTQQKTFMALLRAIKLHNAMGWEENVPRPRVRICLPLP